MKMFFHFPPEFDSIQFTRVLLKAKEVAYDIQKYRTSSDEWLKDKFRIWLDEDTAAFNFGCYLLDYGQKEIYDVIRIAKRFDKQGICIDEAEVYCRMVYDPKALYY